MAVTNRTSNGGGDTSKNPRLGSQVADQTTAYNPTGLEASDAKIASDLGISQSQLTPAIISQYSQEVAARSGGTWGQTVMPLLGAAAWGAASGGIGAGIGAALAPTLGAIGGAATGAGIAGAGSGALQAYGSGGNVGSAALHGGASGAVGGALSAGLGKIASGALQNSTGLSSTAANALSRAGLSAAGAAITGGNPLQSGIAGGVGSLAGAGLSSSGVPSGASNFLGNAAGAFGAGILAQGAKGNNGNMAATNAGSALTGLGPQTGLQQGGSMGNVGQGASTDPTLAGTITNALPGLLQGAAGVYGSQNAAQAMTNADKNAIGTQQSTLGNINSIWGTQQQLGQGAQTALGTALGTNGQPADYSGFQNMPGYQFAIQQGTQAIQRQAASMGNAYTPNTAEAVGQYVTGTAAQDYNTYIQQLMGAAGLGSTANAGIATPTYQTGANISTLQQNQGQAQASGVQGAANSIGGMFGPNGAGSSLIGAAGKYLGSSNSNNSSGINYGPNNAQSGAPAPTDANGGLNGGYIDPNGPNPFGDGSTSAPDTSNIGNIDTGSWDIGGGGDY